jgi:hypothetical protein
VENKASLSTVRTTLSLSSATLFARKRGKQKKLRTTQMPPAYEIDPHLARNDTTILFLMLENQRNFTISDMQQHVTERYGFKVERRITA